MEVLTDLAVDSKGGKSATSTIALRRKTYHQSRCYSQEGGKPPESTGRPPTGRPPTGRPPTGRASEVTGRPPEPRPTMEATRVSTEKPVEST